MLEASFNFLTELGGGGGKFLFAMLLAFASSPRCSSGKLESELK